MSDQIDARPSSVISGLTEIRPPTHEDERGMFVESFCADTWPVHRGDGALLQFVEDDYSVSAKNVIRGFHGDDRTWKLVSCAQGACFLVVVDVRRGRDHAVWQSFELRGSEPHHVLVPAGCATGFASLRDSTIFTYKQSERYRGASGQFAIRWNDPQLAIPWPIADPILSERDRSAPLLSE